MKETTRTNRAVELTGSIGSWLVPLLVYVYTIAPCVTAGDAGEFIVAVHRFSLPHAPGYPLYAILMKAWSVLPLGVGPDPLALKCNLFSAVGMTLMCGVFYRAARTLSGSAAASLAATLSLAFSRTVWKMAVVTEAFALHLLLVVLIIAGLALAREGKKPIGLVLAAFAFGLGLAHHHTIFFFLPLLVFMWPRGAFEKGVPVLGIIAGFVLPLLLYLLLPVFAANTPEYAGSGFTLGNFVDTITRAEYRQRTETQDVPPDQLVRPRHILARALKYLPRQFGWLLLVAGIVGWFMAPAGKRVWAFWFFATALFMIVGVMYFSRGSPLGMPFIHLRSVDRFLLPINILLAFGLAWLLKPIALKLESRADFAGTEGQNFIRAEYIPVAITLLLCVVPFFVALVNNPYSNMTHHTFSQDQARNVLEQVPGNGVLVVSGDESYLYDYLQIVRGIRTDVEMKVWPFQYSVGGPTMDVDESLAFFLSYELGDRGCVFTFGDASRAVATLTPPKALRLDGVALALVDRGEGEPDFTVGDPNIWTTYQLRNLDPATLAGVVPDDYEYEIFDRYINGLKASIAWMNDMGYSRDPAKEALTDIAAALQKSLERTDYRSTTE
jgi:hypothetical protein